jgi:hypothetical protein
MIGHLGISKWPARISDRHWAGLSSDLVIEQVLMRGLKTSGGLARGSGMSETQRLVWLLSRGVTSEMNLAMQEFSGVSYETSEQHKDISSARITRDVNDTYKMVAYLSSRNPFTDTLDIYNLATGVTADLLATQQTFAGP